MLFLKGWKRKLVSAICIIANRILKWTHFSRNFINKRYLKSATKYNGQKTEWGIMFLWRDASVKA